MRTRWAALFLVLLNVFLSSWYLLHAEIHFHTDIARDFFLLDELVQKKLVLIGPRSSIPGLFHGPLWSYVNLPAFYLSGGNPALVGWFWLILWVVFLLVSFKVAKNLINEKAAYIYVVLLSTFMIVHVDETFHPHGAVFLAPLFFYTFIRYWETRRPLILGLHLLITGLMIQFQMAMGVPLLVLSSLFIIYQIVRNRKPLHFLTFLILVIPISTFLLFDYRHNFSQVTAIISFLSVSQESGNFKLFDLLVNRLNFLVSTGVSLFYQSDWLNRLIFLPFLFMICVQIYQNNYRKLYLAFLYFFFGFGILSIANGGVVLQPHYFAMVPLIFLTLSSLVTSKYRTVFLLILGGVYVTFLNNGFSYLNYWFDYAGKNETSWQFQHQLAKSVFQDAHRDFGYFIYSPDLYGYSPKYAMAYTNKEFGGKGSSLMKKPTTYLIYAPTPEDQPWLNNSNDKYWATDKYWKINKVRINKSPIWSLSFPNGYRWEKYHLTEEEIETPYIPDLDFGLTFR